MKYIDSSGVDYDCPVRYLNTVDLSQATVTLPSTQFRVLRYVSQQITHSDLTGGSASQVINLAGEPTAMIPLAAYVVTAATTTSSSGNTTGLTAEVGVSGDPDGYLTSISVFGSSGRKEAPAGVMISSYRHADALQLKLTATGGTPDIGHINSMRINVVVLYLEVAAET